MKSFAMIKYLLVICPFLLLFNLIPFAQANYIKGTIITHNNDTLNGLIDYQNWSKNPETIKFKKDADSHIIYYQPDQIKSFYMANEYYISQIVTVSRASHNLQKLQKSVNEIELRSDTVTLFLKTLIEGEASLYYYKDEDATEHFYIKKDTIVDELLYIEYLVTYNLRKLEKYKGQLIHYLNDCLELANEISELQFKSNDLIKLFTKYNTCVGSGNTYKIEKPKIEYEPMILVGISFTSLSFESETPGSLSETDYENSVDPALGLALNIVFPGNRKKWSVYNELIYKKHSFKGKYKDIKYGDWYDLISTSFDFEYLKMSNLVRFQLYYNNIRPYFGFGITNSYITKTSNSKIIETFNDPVYNKREKNALDLIRKYEQGFAADLGFIYRNFFIEYRFEKGNGFSEYWNLASNLKTNYILIGYKF